MYRDILFGIDTDMKNKKVLEEIAKLSGEGTVVTMINMISEKDIQASVRTGVHFEEMTEKRQKDIQHVFDFFNERNIKYNLVFIKVNTKTGLLKLSKSGEYEIVVLSDSNAEYADTLVLGSVSHKESKRT